MNRSQIWKFMLSTLTLWLAFAVASPAQDCVASGNNADTWANDCVKGGSNYNSANVCQLSNNTCSLTVGQSNGTTAVYIGTNTTASDPVCIPENTTVNWTAQTTVAVTQAGFIVDFTGTNGSPVANQQGSQAVIAGTSSGSGGTVSANLTSYCYKYTAVYCGAGQSCAAPADPRIVSNCTGSCPVLPKPKAH